MHLPPSELSILLVYNSFTLNADYLIPKTGQNLNEFVRDAALPYLEDDHAEVRKAAALTCSNRCARDLIHYQGCDYSMEIINDILGKLLTVGVADPGACA